MQLIINPPKQEWQQLAQRPVKPEQQLKSLVEEVFDAIRQKGDDAIKEYTLRFDKIKSGSIKLDQQEINTGAKKVPGKLKSAIKMAAANIKEFHASQKENKTIIESTPGVKCWRESRPIHTVGIYIPGGSAPLFSTVLMLGLPATLAGCKQIVLCTPPDKNGEINPAILYTAKLIGITAVFKVGGIQAIAAMTIGTETIPKVDKLFGPGNQYVTAAKQYAQNFIPIDLPAGPSEVLIIADKNAEAGFVAADLLSQAEHGNDSQVILLSTDKKIIEKTIVAMEQQLVDLPRSEIIREAIINSKAILLNTLEDCIAFSNLYAPEHLILALKKPGKFTQLISNAGSVFLGNYSCESAGDYASGTNHTLPTNGYARNYSGVSLDSFIKKISFQQLNKKGIKNLGPTIEIMAEAESLQAHKNAVSIRLKTLIK